MGIDQQEDDMIDALNADLIDAEGKIEQLKLELHARSEAYRLCHQQHEAAVARVAVLEAAQARVLALIAEDEVDLVDAGSIRRALGGSGG